MRLEIVKICSYCFAWFATFAQVRQIPSRFNIFIVAYIILQAGDQCLKK